MIDDFKQLPPRPRPLRVDSNQVHNQRTTPTFRTPEQVATTDAAATPILPNLELAETDISQTLQISHTPGTAATEATDSYGEELLLPEHGTADQSAKKAFLAGTITLFKRWTVTKKKFVIISAVAAVVLLGGGTGLAMALSGDEPVKETTVTKAKVAVPTPAPAPIVSPLTGITVTADQQKLPVIGVMIENSPNARPQSGLKNAGVVFEAIAEAGITRFLALYQEDQAGNLGPIRSARPYYLDWAMAFDASYAHVGGSPDALARIKSIGVRDLDQFYNPSAYHRITSRYAPHNVYSSVGQLADLAKGKGYETSTFTGFSRKAEKPYVAPAAATPTSAPAAATTKKTTASSAPAQAPTDNRTAATGIDLNISSANYNAHYDYDSASNSYNRSMAGAIHKDADSGTQLSSKVVIALAMPYSLMADGYHSQYATIGSGKMFVFQDGTVTTGIWTKGQPTEQFSFKDDAGNVLKLNPGQTWISIVSDASKVTYR